jgi:hypothetical protein
VADVDPVVSWLCGHQSTPSSICCLVLFWQGCFFALRGRTLSCKVLVVSIIRCGRDVLLLRYRHSSACSNARWNAVVAEFIGAVCPADSTSEQPRHQRLLTLLNRRELLWIRATWTPRQNLNLTSLSPQIPRLDRQGRFLVGRQLSC